MRSSALVLTACLLIAGCGDSNDKALADKSVDSTANKTPVVLVTSQPLFETATLLAGDDIDIRKITPDNVSSRLWRPRKEDVKRLQEADLILISGAGYEPWKDRVSLPGSRLKDTAAGYYSQFIRIPDAITHQHGPEGKHAHPGTVWATWLDPELADAQFTRVGDLLAELMPSASDEVATALTSIKSEIARTQSLAADLATRTADKEFTVVGDSPNFHYLTNKLGWRFQYVHWDESQELTSRAKDELTALADKLPKQQPWFFLLSSLQTESAADFAADSGFTVIRIDLCEYPIADSSSSLFERLQSNFLRLEAAVGRL